MKITNQSKTFMRQKRGKHKLIFQNKHSSFPVCIRSSAREKHSWCSSGQGQSLIWLQPSSMLSSSYSLSTGGWKIQGEGESNVIAAIMTILAFPGCSKQKGEIFIFSCKAALTFTETHTKRWRV